MCQLFQGSKRNYGHLCSKKERYTHTIFSSTAVLIKKASLETPQGTFENDLKWKMLLWRLFFFLEEGVAESGYINLLYYTSTTTFPAWLQILVFFSSVHIIQYFAPGVLAKLLFKPEKRARHVEGPLKARALTQSHTLSAADFLSRPRGIQPLLTSCAGQQIYTLYI